MLIHLHSQATTTPKVRAEFQASGEPAWAMAKRYGTTDDLEVAQGIIYLDVEQLASHSTVETFVVSVLLWNPWLELAAFAPTALIRPSGSSSANQPFTSPQLRTGGQRRH